MHGGDSYNVAACGHIRWLVTLTWLGCRSLEVNVRGHFAIAHCVAAQKCYKSFAQRLVRARGARRAGSYAPTAERARVVAIRVRLFGAPSDDVAAA